MHLHARQFITPLNHRPPSSQRGEGPTVVNVGVSEIRGTLFGSCTSGDPNFRGPPIFVNLSDLLDIPRHSNIHSGSCRYFLASPPRAGLKQIQGSFGVGNEETDRVSFA